MSSSPFKVQECRTNKWNHYFWRNSLDDSDRNGTARNNTWSKTNWFSIPSNGKSMCVYCVTLQTINITEMSRHMTRCVCENEQHVIESSVDIRSPLEKIDIKLWKLIIFWFVSIENYFFIVFMDFFLRKFEYKRIWEKFNFYCVSFLKWEIFSFYFNNQPNIFNIYHISNVSARFIYGEDSEETLFCRTTASD